MAHRAKEGSINTSRNKLNPHLHPLRALVAALFSVLSLHSRRTIQRYDKR